MPRSKNSEGVKAPDMDDGVRTDADGGRFLCLRLTVYEDVHTALFRYLSDKRPKRRSRLLLAHLSGIAGDDRFIGDNTSAGSAPVVTLAGSVTPTTSKQAPSYPEAAGYTAPQISDDYVGEMDL